jgi:hypothetical protein
VILSLSALIKAAAAQIGKAPPGRLYPVYIVAYRRYPHTKSGKLTTHFYSTILCFYKTVKTPPAIYGAYEIASAHGRYVLAKGIYCVEVTM